MGGGLPSVGFIVFQAELPVTQAFISLLNHISSPISITWQILNPNHQRNQHHRTHHHNIRSHLKPTYTLSFTPLPENLRLRKAPIRFQACTWIGIVQGHSEKWLPGPLQMLRFSSGNSKAYQGIIEASQSP